MGLSTSMNAALTGLRASQRQLDVTAQNIANVDTPGFTRRRLTLTQQVADGRTTGVGTGALIRQFDQVVQRQLRTETAGAAYTDVRARFLAQIDQMFGTPGSATALDGLVNGFSGSLQALAANPADPAARAGVLRAAETLAGTLNRLSGEVQALRAATETGLAEGVARANALLARIEAADARITASGARGDGDAALLDERDLAINELSALMDLRVVTRPDGRVSLFTSAGLTLYDGRAAALSFDARSPITAAALFTTDPAQRGVGTIRVNGSVDVIAGGLFRSGELAALIELRDRTLVQAQSQLDELAAGLASALGDRDPTLGVSLGAAAGFETALEDPLSPGQLAMRAGNTLTLEVSTPTGRQRIHVVATDGPAPNPLPPGLVSETGATIVRFDRAGGFAGLQAAVAAALPPGFSATLEPGNRLRIVNTVAGARVEAQRAAFTSAALAGTGPELPLFVDTYRGGAPYAGSLDGALPEKLGFAARIGVNRQVLADPSRLVVHDAGIAAGDPTRPQLLLQRLTGSVRGFSGETGVGDRSFGTRATVVGFAQRIVEHQGASAASAQRLDEGQKVVLRQVEARFSRDAGVDLDHEMAEMVQIQNAYAANARVVATVKELLDVLLRIGS